MTFYLNIISPFEINLISFSLELYVLRTSQKGIHIEQIMRAHAAYIYIYRTYIYDDQALYIAAARARTHTHTHTYKCNTFYRSYIYAAVISSI